MIVFAGGLFPLAFAYVRTDGRTTYRQMSFLVGLGRGLVDFELPTTTLGVCKYKNRLVFILMTKRSLYSAHPEGS